MTAIEPKALAAQMQAAYTIHEASYNREKWEYNKDWHTACEEAGMPQVWAKLLAPYMTLGYADTWEWVEEVLNA